MPASDYYRPLRVSVTVYVYGSERPYLLVYGNLSTPLLPCSSSSSSSSSSSTGRGGGSDGSKSGLSAGATAAIVLFVLLLVGLLVPCLVAYCLYRFAGVRFPLLARLSGGRLFADSNSSQSHFGLLSTDDEQRGSRMGVGSFGSASNVPMLNSR